MSDADPLRDSLPTATPGFVSSDWVAAGEQWLEVAQFQSEDRARQFREDFMSWVESYELGLITGLAPAGMIADNLGTDSQWQVIDRQSLERLKAGEWTTRQDKEGWHSLESQLEKKPSIHPDM